MARPPSQAELVPSANLPVCLRCGVPASSPHARVCRRCGLPLGAPPGPGDPLPTCPVCYRQADPDGRFPSLLQAGRRLDLIAHQEEHERVPVGDDEYLESLRRGDRIRIGRWEAPFDLVRRYLVTGIVDGSRQRVALHNTIVLAMIQLARWGSGTPPEADHPEWEEARAALMELMERYHRGPYPHRRMSGDGRFGGSSYGSGRNEARPEPISPPAGPAEIPRPPAREVPQPASPGVGEPLGVLGRQPA